MTERWKGTVGGTWWPTRRRLALLALLTGVLTAGVASVLGGEGGGRALAVVYMVAVAGALFAPALVAAQVVSGVALLAAVSGTASGGAWFAAALLLGSVVFTAEVLAAVARLDAPLERALGTALPRALASGGAAVAVAAVVFVAAALPGPVGPPAILLAAVACALAGASLVGVGGRPARPAGAGLPSRAPETKRATDPDGR